MSSRLLALPTELKVQIAKSLTPFTGNPSKFHFDCLGLSDDLDIIFISLYHLRSFSMTCKETRAFCSHLLSQVIRLRFDSQRVRFMDESDDGTLPPPYSDAKHTQFLSLERFDDWDLPDPGEPPAQQSYTAPILIFSDWDFTVDARSDLERSVGKLFERFSCVTTLNLDRFPLSSANIRALKSLKALQTLSIRCPDPTYDSLPSTDEFQSADSMPPVSNLNVQVLHAESCRSISSILKIFEKSLVMLSILGYDYGEVGDDDFLDALFFSDTHNIQFEKLQHLSVDFIWFGSRSLRRIVNKCKSLESLTVDCRGTSSFLPLFYVVDLLRICSGEQFDITPMKLYDSVQDMLELVPENAAKYAHDPEVWNSRLSRFFYSFAIVEYESGPVKTLEHLELAFSSGNGHFDPMNVGMKFGELSVVFCAHALMFRELKTLTILTTAEHPFESTETEDQLKDALALMCRDYLPSVRRVNVKWGQMREFSWPPSEGNADEMDTDVA